MADPIEELLKQIQQNETARPCSAASSSADPLPSNLSSDLPLPTDRSKPKPIDHLLAEIEGKPAVKPVPISEEPLQSGHSAPLEAAKPARPSNPHSVDALLSQLDGTMKNLPPSQPPILPIAPSQPRPTAPKPNPPKPVLSPNPQSPNPQSPNPQSLNPKSFNPQKNSQIEKQRRRQAIERKAQEWLKNLDPHGGEAHFFEKLSEKYPSRLEAAIDFLGLEQE